MNITEPSFDDDELRLVKQCLDSHWVTQGPMTAQFEKRFAAKHQVDYALATTSCTAALHLAALALELKSGDEVIVPAFTWVTSAHCAEYANAKAVFADVEFESYNLDPAALEAAITPRTRAIVAVHLFGLPAKMDQIMAIAKQHALAVIEDAACAVGTTYKNVPVGGIGDIGCFSFHPRKVITTGEGGMVTTNRADLADRVKSLRNHGSTGPAPGDDPAKPYTMSTFNRLGYNLRLSDIQAAVGLAQMAKLDRLLTERRARAERYSSLLASATDIRIPTRANCDGHAFQSYVVRVLEGGRKRRNRIMDHLARHEIATRPGTHAVHRLGYYRNRYGYHPDAFPIASESEDTTITLPLFPAMSDADQDRVVGLLFDSLRV